MKNIHKLSFLMLASIFILFTTSCENENFDTTTEHKLTFEPEAIYTGADNEFNLNLYDRTSGTAFLSGTSVDNNLVKEILSTGEIQWKLSSTIIDGFTVTTEITFTTKNTDAGVYEIDQIYFKNVDQNGVITEEYLWDDAQLSINTMNVTSLEDSPGIVSGYGHDVLIEVTPELNYVFLFDFSEVPIN